jgi:transposase
MSKHSDHLFKPYRQGQTHLFPPSVESLISENHPVRLINRVIDELDISPILSMYPGGGSSSYHPRMMLKVLVYAYVRNIYSSRKIEQAIQEHVHFMWLAGGNQPDHNSINRFRSNRLKGTFQSIFSQVVLLLHESGYLTIKDLYTDGTKIEANANRYTFVWGKSIDTNRKRISAQLKELWAYAERVAKEELMDTQPCDFDELDPEAVAKTIAAIDDAIKASPDSDPKKKQKASYGRKNWPKKLKQYQQDKEKLGDRNSFSKTDPDATFMRMKEDHMKNGQLKAGYNLELSTNNQFIVHYSLHHNPTDTLTLKPHLAGYYQYYNQYPEVLTADAGYGSEENYAFLEENKTLGYVKYNYFHKEQKKAFQKKYPFHPNTLHYDPHKDLYICPMGQPMKNIGSYVRKSSNQYPQHITRYQAQNCHGCPLRTACHKGKEDRIIEVNHQLNRYKQQARQRLTSEQGIEKRKRRGCEVEAVFGNLKQNHGFKRFALRGMQKVEVETGLHALAHNFRKWAAEMLEMQLDQAKKELKAQYQSLIELCKSLIHHKMILALK